MELVGQRVALPASMVRRFKDEIAGLEEVCLYLMQANSHPSNLDHPLLDKVESAEALLYWLQAQCAS